MSHKIHGAKFDEKLGNWIDTHSIPEGYLDPTCEDCQHKEIGNLSDPHFRNATGIDREWFERALNGLPEGIRHELVKMKALPLMERRLSRVANKEALPLSHEDMAFAHYYRSRPWEAHYQEDA